MKFDRPAGSGLAFSETAWGNLLGERQLNGALAEAGGVLLGRLIADSTDVVVDEVTTPAEDDQRGRFFFRRSAASTQRRVDRAWRDSAQTRNYLGEWHTHPEDDPTPSATDVGDWSRILKTARFEQDSLFFVIVGRVHTRIWEGRKDTGVLLALRTDPELGA